MINLTNIDQDRLLMILIPYYDFDIILEILSTYYNNKI